MKSFSLGVVILAAGSSRRMGRPKLLLPWGPTSVLGHLIQSWEQQQAGQIAVVCAKPIQVICDELDRLHFPDENRILNSEPERGMFSSIQCAAAWSGWKPELTHWAVVLGDQPHLQPDTLRRLVDFGMAHPDNVCQPLRQGRRRHPVLLPKQAFIALGSAPAADLKSFLELRRKELAGFDATDPGLDIDIDQPEDYEHAQRLYFGNSGR